VTVASHIIAFPKPGHTPAEYEDAHALAADGWPVRAAVADGATESAFAGAWARTLAEAYVRDPQPMVDPASWLQTCRQDWAAVLAQDTKPMPWYAAAKAAEGAHAAFLGVSLRPDGSYIAHAVGDCCVVHLRDGVLHRAWPIDDPDAFTHHPELLSSRDGAPAPTFESTVGEVAPGDSFWLATDAVAAYLMRENRGATLAAAPPDERAAILRAAQMDGLLRNDDSTVLMLTLSSDT